MGVGGGGREHYAGVDTVKESVRKSWRESCVCVGGAGNASEKKVRKKMRARRGREEEAGGRRESRTERNM